MVQKLRLPATFAPQNAFWGGKNEAMLELRPNCENCDADLPPASLDARICTYECTFCATCADGVLGGVCPNCTGELVRRPVRPESMLGLNPASTERVLRDTPITAT